MANKAKKTFRISGRVIARKTRRGVAGLRVEAWDKDLIWDDLVGSAVTDEQGAFRMKFDESYFQELFLDRRPDLFFKVFHKDVLLKSTEDSVLWNVKVGETAIVIEIDAPLAERRRRPMVQVAVCDHKNNLLPNARVTLKPLGKKPGRIINLKFDKQWQVYQTPSINPGNYLLQAEAEGFESDQREVQVDPSGLKETFILGKKGMPFLYRGRVKVPFEPQSDLLGVSVKHDLSDKQEEELLVYARELKLQPEEIGEQIRKQNVRVFRFPTNTNERDKTIIQGRLSEHPLVQSVGPVVRIDKESLSFLTTDLVVKFKSHVSKDEVPDFAKRFKLSVVRQIPYAGNAFQLRFEAPASDELLSICAEIMNTGMVEYAEPDLFTTMVEDQINPTDFLYPEQWHLPIINAPGAWQILANINPNLTFGSPDIIIAVVDSGVDANNQDFSGNVTNGNPKIYELYDFANMQPNNNNLTSSHGTGCAGAANAQANNPSPVAGQNEGVVGIAGNCRLIGVRGGGQESRYADAYVWLAGFNANSVTANFPQSISPGADIITCSLGLSWPIGGLMEDTFAFLTTYGRGGKGVLLFFSVGNTIPPQDFTLRRTWAAHEKTFAIAASTLANDGVTEVVSSYSGFGGIGIVDLCAPSHDDYIGEKPFHNPPQNYGAITCDRVGHGNMLGHAAVQTALSQAAPPAPFTTLSASTSQGDTTINVGSNNGFVVNQWVLVGQHNVCELVQITAIPAGNTQLTVTALQEPDNIWGLNYRAGTVVIGVTPIDVTNNAGFAANQWLLMDQPGQAGAEAALIQDVPAGTNQIMVAGPLNNHGVNTPVIGGPNDYRNSHGGTSFSTPICAGVAALVLSANPDLSWVQVRQILRDTAIHIDLTPTGQWVDMDGDGVVDYSRLYGFGRVDAQAAVQRAVDLIGVNVLNHIDTWIRENSADVGDVPSLPPYSPDVWVRNVDPATDDPAQVTQHQRPIRGQDNWVYANIRNRGAVDSHDIYVRILITRWAGTQYIYPDDFIPTNPPGTDPVQPLEPGTYLIGELHIDSIPAGGVVTINTIWEAALVPPASVVINGITYSWADACLLVDVSPHDGPTPTGNNTWDNNNICQKNVFPVDPVDSDDFAIGFVVGHYTNYANLFNLRIERKNLPAEIKLHFDYIDKKVIEEVKGLLDDLKERPYMLNTCDLTILTEAKGRIQCSRAGEISPVIIAPNTRLTFPCCHQIGKPTNYQLNPVLKENRTVFAMPTVCTTYVPVPRKGGEYQIVALLGKGLRNLKKGEYQIDVYQEDLTGKTEGGVNFIIRKK